MLVISLKPGEEVRIGRDITVKVIKSNQGLVRLGIEAPKTLNVARKGLEADTFSENKQKSENKT